MARARLGFSAINNRIELTDLNHGTTAARWHQFANRRQFNAKLGGCSFNLIFCFRHDRQQQTARSLRIAQQIAHFTRHFTHQMTVAGKVTFGAAVHCAQLNVLFNPGNFGIAS